MIVKILGLIDIFSALIIMFNVYEIHWVVNTTHGLILLGKGATSLAADTIGIVYGVTDIVASIFIFFAITGFLPVKVVIFVILAIKGAMSLI